MQPFSGEKQPPFEAPRGKPHFSRALLAGCSLTSLMLASTIAVADPELLAALGDPTPDNFAISALNYGLLGGFSLLVGVAGYGLIWNNRHTKQALARAEREISHFKGDVTMMHAVLNTQPQIVLELIPKNIPKLLFHSLQNHTEIPAGPRELMDFPGWIGEGLPDLKKKLVSLISRGHPFCITVRTTKGLLMEAEGQTSGEALLVFRDLSGSLRNEVRMLDEQEMLKKQNHDHAVPVQCPAHAGVVSRSAKNN